MKEKNWSPYFVGCLIGLLSTISFFAFHKMLGTSTTFVKLAGIAWGIINPQHLKENTYYQLYLDQHAWIDWQFALVIGIVLGAFIARGNSVNSLTIWHQQIGPSPWKRYVGAFLGGVILLFGARLAGGCTSGHAISGGVQLALSSWLFMFGVFATGIPTAFLLYHTRRR